MLTLKRCRSCGQIEIYIMYLFAYIMYICACVGTYMCGGFNTLIGAKMTTGLARVCGRVAGGVYACACKTRARNLYTRTHGRGGGRSCIIRSSWASTRGIPVAPGTGRQKRLNCPHLSRALSGGDSSSPPFCAPPRVPGCPTSPSTFYTNDITVSPKFAPPPIPLKQ